VADDDLPALLEYYNAGGEQARLADARGSLELERTKLLIQRSLAPDPSDVADVGGGPGAYTLWLAELGHRVVHRDLVPLHVEQLLRLAPDIDSCVADARALDLADASFDAVLLLGPLYHLERRADRLRALEEAHRILRPGGVVFASAISRWAARLDGILQGQLYKAVPFILDELGSMERSGWMRPIAPGGFFGYAHRPSQLRREVRAAGFDEVSVVAVEGPGFGLHDLDQRMRDPTDRGVVMDAALALEAVPELMGLGPHLLATGTKA
jgi:SAM-dependent methyltransferase